MEHGRGCRLVAECIGGEGRGMYESGQGCGVVCADGRVFFNLSHPPVRVTHPPVGMVSLKAAVLGMVRGSLLGLCVCRCTRSKCRLKL